MESNLQICIQEARYKYEGRGQTPLLEQLFQVHGLTQRDAAKIFGISKAHAENLLKHKVFPSVPIALRIARYFECTVEELFGWRVDDTGDRRPLVVLDRETGKVRRLTTSKMVKALDLIEKAKASCGDDG